MKLRQITEASHISHNPMAWIVAMMDELKLQRRSGTRMRHITFDEAKQLHKDLTAEFGEGKKQSSSSTPYYRWELPLFTISMWEYARGYGVSIVKLKELDEASYHQFAEIDWLKEGIQKLHGWWDENKDDYGDAGANFGWKWEKNIDHLNYDQIANRITKTFNVEPEMYPVNPDVSGTILGDHDEVIWPVGELEDGPEILIYMWNKDRERGAPKDTGKVFLAIDYG